MFLKKKKLRGMSLVELLAYTVILSIVTTALFQAIHFIEKMNDDLNNEQQMLNEFNLSILKLDKFVSDSKFSELNTSPANDCLFNDGSSGSPIKAFYFQKDADFYKLIESDVCLQNGNFSTNSIFSLPSSPNNFFFQLDNTKKAVKYNFIFKSNLDLKFDAFSFAK
jgi:type II secretory pathway pseudopilin PulG